MSSCRFNFSSFSCTLFKFNSNQAVISRNQLLLCSLSTPVFSPTCSAPSILRTTTRRLRKRPRLLLLSNKIELFFSYTLLFYIFISILLAVSYLLTLDNEHLHNSKRSSVLMQQLLLDLSLKHGESVVPLEKHFAYSS